MPRDREKQRAYWRNWYRNNPEKAKEYYRQKARRRKKEIQKWYHAYKDTLSCKRCGEEENVCLDFHHLDPSTKELNPGLMVGQSYSKARIKKEIQKCIVLCSNCHRKEHAKIRNNKKREKRSNA